MRPGGDYNIMQYPHELYIDESMQKKQLSNLLYQTRRQSIPAFQFFMDYAKLLVQNTEWYESKTW
jgi:hypothetical protein